MNYRVKTNFDRGYVNAMDKVRVFIESNQKVMFVNTDEYKDAKNARAAYVNAEMTKPQLMDILKKADVI